MKNKNFRLMLTALALLLSALLSGAWANSWVDGNSRTWTYTLSGGKATLTGVSPLPVNLTIPQVLDGYSLVAIGDEAFKENPTLRNLTVV